MSNDLKVFKEIKKCMRSLSSTSGHLGGYLLDESSFRIVKSEGAASRCTYSFTVTGQYESEFDREYPPEELQGSITLDENFKVIVENEKALLHPWNHFIKPKSPEKIIDQTENQLDSADHLSTDEINKLLENLEND